MHLFLPNMQVIARHTFPKIYLNIKCQIMSEETRTFLRAYIRLYLTKPKLDYAASKLKQKISIIIFKILTVRFYLLSQKTTTILMQLHMMTLLDGKISHILIRCARNYILSFSVFQALLGSCICFCNLNQKLAILIIKTKSSPFLTQLANNGESRRFNILLYHSHIRFPIDRWARGYRSIFVILAVPKIIEFKYMLNIIDRL